MESGLKRDDARKLVELDLLWNSWWSEIRWLVGKPLFRSNLFF